MNPKAFLAIPYGNNYKWICDAIAAACRKVKIEPVVNSEQITPGQSIIDLMDRQIEECDLGIVVATDLNPNVMHEHGLLKGKNKKIIVVFDKKMKLPFDLRNFSSVPYDAPECFSEQILLEILSTNLTSLTESALLKILNPINPVETNNLTNSREVFGYFYYQVKGFERILIHNISPGKWDFPFKGKFPAHMAAKQAVDSLVKHFIEETPAHKEWFNNTAFSSPEIFEIYPSDKQLATDDDRKEPLPVFFKIRVNNNSIELSFAQGEYCWALKSLLFRRMRLCQISSGAECEKEIECKPLSPRLLWYVRSDKIILEYGLKVLEGVDIITYKENGGIKEFLMLHRRNDKDQTKNKLWEYPKGGLEYHESIQEGAIRELLEETGVETIGVYRFGGELTSNTSDISVITPDVSIRKDKLYNTLRVHCLTYRLIEEKSEIHFSTEEHDKFSWFSFQTAYDKVWMPYGKGFFKQWKEMESKIAIVSRPPVSLAFQVTEECPHTCLYCHRRKVSEKLLNENDILKIIEKLAQRRILRLTFTGGEPLQLGKNKLFKLIEYAHAAGIHTCLSTTGIAGKNDNQRLNRNDLEILDQFLDHLLLTLNCIDENCAKNTYGKLDDWKDLFDMIRFLLQPRSNSFRIEVCTAVTRQNIDSIDRIGTFIYNSNPDIFWRVDEYYPNGTQNSAQQKHFELQPGEFEELTNRLKSRFDLQYNQKQVNFNSLNSRKEAPDIMLTPGGKMVTSSQSKYNKVGDHLDINFKQFENRRSYNEYRAYCRPWVWDTQCDWEGYSGCDEFNKWYKNLSEEQQNGEN